MEVTGPDENAYWEIVIPDLANGGVVTEDGYGKTYWLESNKAITILKEGHYEIGIKGNKVTVNLEISL